MSDEQFKAFLARVNDDAGLQERIRANPHPETVEALARELGFDSFSEQPQAARRCLNRILGATPVEPVEEELEGLAALRVVMGGDPLREERDDLI
jgi:predicted ribosomally synthesized peptide with nif11-like leader